MDFLTTEQAAEKAGTAAITARIWAKDNNVQRLGKSYLWTDDDLLRFQKRNRQRGKPAHKSKS